MIPKTAEYALRAAVILARGLGSAHSAEQIAEATRLPRRYAHKVLQALVRAGLVRSQSGPGGGYTLVRPPVLLTVIIGVVLVSVGFYLSRRSLLVRQRAAEVLAEQKERLLLAALAASVLSISRDLRAAWAGPDRG